MSVQLINPPTLPSAEVYAQLSVAEGSKMVFISGQVARDASGTPVGEGDLERRRSRPTPTSMRP